MVVTVLSKLFRVVLVKASRQKKGEVHLKVLPQQMGMPEVTRTAVKAFVRNRMLPRFAPSDFFVWELKHYFLLRLSLAGHPLDFSFNRK